MTLQRIQPRKKKCGTEVQTATHAMPFPKTLLSEAFERAAELVRSGQFPDEAPLRRAAG